MSSIDVTISIVSYNSKNVIANCLDSVIETVQGMDIEVIVSDNCSEDGTAALIKSRYPGIRLIENRGNLGFGKAHNQSFRVSKGNYFLILNPDTIVYPKAIRRMVEFMNSHNNAGVVGCKIYWDDGRKFMFPDLRIHSLKTALMQFTPFCQYFPNNFFSRWYWKSAQSVWKTSKPVEVEGITGGLMMVRRNVFESVNGFDEHFFLFFEEHDLLRRIKKDGWSIYYVPDAEIQHFYEESFRNSNIDIGAVYMQSALYYYKKHYKWLGYAFIKSLLSMSRLLFSPESRFALGRRRYTEIRPSDDMIFITWPPHEGARKYLIELSYSPSFCDRGGMYSEGEKLYLKKDILTRLPNKTGFLRILPLYDDNSTGNVIKVIKIVPDQNDLP